MKLRNKRTGEIYSTWNICIGGEKITSVKQFNDTFEDYEPKEPLIKDEKIRKAIRAWAEANEIERVWHEYSSSWLRGNGLKIELENEVVELEQGNYSIAELCGEEEAPEPLEPSFIDLDERIREKEEE